MKKILGSTVALAAMAIFISSAQAAIKIEVAEVQNGVAFIKGNGAPNGAQITWESRVVTTANNKNGGFSFFGTLPLDCKGKLNDTAQTVSVDVLNCTPTERVLQTGQTTCYDTDGEPIFCAGTGQDGELRKGVARSYTDNGATITDNATGLEWEKLKADGTINDRLNAYTWIDAFAKIATLNADSFAGRNDWRLPNINELQTLVHYGNVLPAVDSAFNGGDSFTVSSFYWSSTTSQGNPTSVWGVLFGDGSVVTNSKSTGIDGVRAVRGGS